MVFSTPVFLFVFLPIVTAIYFLIPARHARNLFMTAASLCFYAWGEPVFALVMLLSIAVNWFVALRVEDGSRGWLRAGVAFNLLLLGGFKYLMFLMENLNWALGLRLPVPEIALPIGISFFTFQAISYIVDVSRGKGRAQKSFFNVCLYISFFPQLIAGPIVRYETFAGQIESREETFDGFCSGVRRFLVGLCKKAILANALAGLVDTAFAIEPSSLSTVATWLAAIAYLMQVYYDFSGYSDMAIGLGRMFGFHFLENFDKPFLSKSVTEFWRRWHISLSTWFRDYLYYPLGGSRVRTGRLVMNMFIVWTLTGLWHGAQWTYALWGFSFFALLAFERFTGAGKWLGGHWLGHVYAMAAVVTVTVLIRSADLYQAGQMYLSMFALDGSPFFDDVARMFLREWGVFLALGAVCAVPPPKKTPDILRVAALGGATLIAVSYVVMGSYNPFIYFNF